MNPEQTGYYQDPEKKKDISRTIKNRLKRKRGIISRNKT